MPIKSFKASVRMKTGKGSVVQVVKVEADNFYNAKVMLEAQYGKGSIVSPPVETR